MVDIVVGSSLQTIHQSLQASNGLPQSHSQYVAEPGLKSMWASSRISAPGSYTLLSFLRMNPNFKTKGCNNYAHFFTNMKYNLESRKILHTHKPKLVNRSKKSQNETIFREKKQFSLNSKKHMKPHWKKHCFPKANAVGYFKALQGNAVDYLP